MNTGIPHCNDSLCQQYTMQPIRMLPIWYCVNYKHASASYRIKEEEEEEKKSMKMPLLLLIFIDWWIDEKLKYPEFSFNIGLIVIHMEKLCSSNNILLFRKTKIMTRFKWVIFFFKLWCLLKTHFPPLSSNLREFIPIWFEKCGYFVWLDCNNKNHRLGKQGMRLILM